MHAQHANNYKYFAARNHPFIKSKIARKRATGFGGSIHLADCTLEQNCWRKSLNIAYLSGGCCGGLSFSLSLSHSLGMMQHIMPCPRHATFMQRAIPSATLASLRRKRNSDSSNTSTHPLFLLAPENTRSHNTRVDICKVYRTQEAHKQAYNTQMFVDKHHA